MGRKGTPPGAFWGKVCFPEQKLEPLKERACCPCLLLPQLEHGVGVGLLELQGPRNGKAENEEPPH